ncbi:HD domain-containing protein [Vibrio sp. T187]|uniref:HD domain-containing phosphohydrolase n=1 Tax=Vibrio TaxID=662 RepID=UPI0010C9FBB7|nr:MULTISPECIES: HD domain-containing phosphohydrolase [Vibrio]MBW3696216.1 HD domain-containing protein [Vibrio sp. T187]
MNKLCRIIFAIVLATVFNAAYANSESRGLKQILVLHSYEPSYQWTSDFQKGIDSALALADTPTKVSIEYLDTKRVNSEEYLSTLQSYLSSKYQDYEFDGVIVTDDNALKFLHRFDLIAGKNIPVVAAGINDPAENLYGITHRGTVIYEKDDIESNIKLILSVQPRIKNLYYLADHSVTSELIRKRVFKAVEQYPTVNIIEISELTLVEASQKLSKVSPDDAVLLTHYNTELASNIYYSYQQIAHTIGEACAAPVFALWEFYIQGGVVGGYVNRSESMGIEAVKSLNQYVPLNFTQDVIPGDNKRAVFDYQTVKTMNINKNTLPSDSIFLNTPYSFFKENLRLVIGVSILIVFLSAIIVMQFATLRQKKELANKNKKILSLQKRTLSVQKEMIHVLGEAIETRSGETGNHVKRVAKLSAFLAKLKGMSHREVEILEIISPMHDVGKISVPESILDKPGKLTDDEWKIMQQHTTTGFKLLQTSDGDITNLAAVIAHEHHERWDGKGYPQGKAGSDIHLFARITAIADVFDALLSVRCYKQAWPIEKVIKLFNDESGKQFDPELTRLLLENIEDFIAIRNTYPDTSSVH